MARGKFEPKWTLPHRVVAVENNGTFRLSDFYGRTLPSLIHRDRLAKITFDES